MIEKLYSFLIYLKESVLFTLSILCLSLIASAGFNFGCHLFHVPMPALLSAADVPEGVKLFTNMPYWRVMLCGLEDVIFVLPSLFLYRMGFHKIMIVVLTFSTFVFISGHLYQGVASGIVKSVYPIFALWYAEKRGLSRTITGHIILDSICWLALRGFL